MTDRTETTIPHAGCKTASECRKEQICLDTWHCSSQQLKPMDASYLLRIATRYENASHYIQGFFYQDQKYPHVIRDLRLRQDSQVIYRTDDEGLYRENLRIEYMRYAMEHPIDG